MKIIEKIQAQGKKITQISPLLLIALLAVSVLGIGAIARFLFTIPIVVDITTIDNPYETTILNGTTMLPVSSLTFEGEAYENDLMRMNTFEANSYLVAVLNTHTMDVYAYIEVEGLTSGTFEVLRRPEGETGYVVVDTFTPGNTTATYGFYFPPESTSRLVRFRVTSEDLATMDLTVKVYGEDALRVT